MGCVCLCLVQDGMHFLYPDYPRRLRNARTHSLFHNKSLSVKMTNHHINAIPWSYSSSWVRECHPVGCVRRGRAALAQLPYLFE